MPSDPSAEVTGFAEFPSPRSANGAPGGGAATSEALLLEAFKDVDRKGTGAVTFGELLRVLERCAGGPVTEDELDNLIEVILYNSIDSGDGDALSLV